MLTPHDLAPDDDYLRSLILDDSHGTSGNSNARGIDVHGTRSVPRLRDRLLTVTQLRDLPAPRWLIHGHTMVDSLVFTYGPRGSYKSFLVADKMAHVATGRPWHGRGVEQGPVLYVVGEGASGLAQRFDAWESLHGPIGDQLVTLPEPVNLLSLPAVAELAATAVEIGARYIVFDTLARCFVGGDENSSRDAGQAVELLDAIRRQTGACIEVVHHSGKDGTKGARGSSAFEAAADTVLEITADGTRVSVRCTKQKNAAEPHAFTLSVEPTGGSIVLCPDRGERPYTHTEGAASALRALAEIDVPGGVSTTDWEVSSGVPRSSFMRYRKILVETGEVSNVGTEKQPRYQVKPAAGLKVSPESQEVS